MEQTPSRRLTLVYSALLVLITLGLGLIAYYAMFSYFDVPDDDGYLLMSLRKFEAGGALYGDVYSQYGPGVYVLVGGLLQLLGADFTSDGARIFNLFLWLGSTLLVGAVLLRLTRSFFISVSGMIVGFLILQIDAGEPMHPGATIAFLLIALVAVAVFLLPQRERAAMAAIGAIAATLLSIKANVGGLTLIAIALACTVAIPALRQRGVIRVAVAAIFVAVPFLLLSDRIDHEWALRFAALVSIGGLSLVVTSTRLPTSTKPTLPGVAALAAGALAILALVSVVPVLGGTTPSELVDGWFIRPAGTVEIIHAPLATSPYAWWWALFGWAGAIAALWASDRSLGPIAATAAGVGRIAVGLIVLASLVGPIFNVPTDLTEGVVVGAPILWLAAIAPVGQSFRDTFLRVLIPALVNLQFLHAYPVPGSQLYWSKFLLVLVGAICLSDGIKQVTAAGRPRLAWRAITTASVVAFAVWLTLNPLRDAERKARIAYETGVSLHLPGATMMHVSEPLYDQMQSLVHALRARCNTFLTLPGMNSLNIFSGKEPPVELSGPWPFFFTDSEQQQIVDDVEHRPRFCMVRKPDLVMFWSAFADYKPPRGPLVDFINDEFVLARDFSGYRLLVRRPVQPVATEPARLRRAP